MPKSAVPGSMEKDPKCTAMSIKDSFLENPARENPAMTPVQEKMLNEIMKLSEHRRTRRLRPWGVLFGPGGA